MSQTYLAQIVAALVVVLPWFGLNLGSEEVTQLAQGVLLLGTVAWTLYRRHKAGDVSVLGVRK